MEAIWNIYSNICKASLGFSFFVSPPSDSFYRGAGNPSFCLLFRVLLGFLG